MAKCVIITPIGFVDEGILDRIARHIEARCGVMCRIFQKMDKPEYAYDKRRCQYNSTSILKHLFRCCPDNVLGFMGVTNVDLYVPILKYVFGLAEMEGQCSVISTYRLRPEFYDRPPDQDLLEERVTKTALHELGHCLGLTHCKNRRCVMYSSVKIEDTDMKRTDFCPTCYELFKWYLDKTLVPPRA
ncbi:MAG: archaemetzincin family Zn-dependent metalloprotease [Deltaproteobacteria bacterium]|nr:archaemetzincin family Zn-dependent metalloprotease [Deltaproteobacteria bacterium]